MVSGGGNGQKHEIGRAAARNEEGRRRRGRRKKES